MTSAQEIDASRLNLPSFSKVEILPSVGSTNTWAHEELAQADVLARRAWGELSLVATADQHSGRGRLDRVWTAPAGTALAVSFVVRPHANPALRIQAQNLHWLTQILALSARHVLDRYGVKSTLKWPNDVLVGGKKCCGILSQLVSESAQQFTVIAGIGLNLNIPEEELPVETATSVLAQIGRTLDITEVLQELAEEFSSLCGAFLRAGADPQRSLKGGLSLIERVRQSMSTLGQEVTVHLPGQKQVQGSAVDINDEGEILIRDQQGQVQAFAVGDVVHLRRQ